MEIGRRGNSTGSAAGSDSIWIMNRIPDTRTSEDRIHRAAMTEGMEIEIEIETGTEIETAIATGIGTETATEIETATETRIEIGSDELAAGAAKPGRNRESRFSLDTVGVATDSHQS